MSGRKRFALAGLLAAALAGPAAAQQRSPQAPMPREKAETRVEIELTFDPVNGIELEWSVVGESVAPAPHEAAVPPCCGPGCGLKPQPAWSGAAAGGVAGGARYCPPHSILRSFGARGPAAQAPGAIAGGAAGACRANPPCPPTGAVPTTGCQGPPNATKQVAADAFYDLLRQSGFLATPQAAPQLPPYPTPGMLGTPACPACPPCPLPLTSVAPKPAVVGTPLVGTWFRDVGANRCVIAVAADHMTITVSQAVELGGRAVTSKVTFTADYHLARDGHTAVGLITGVDMSFDGDAPELGADGMLEAVAALRKAMEDQPFAMNCRLYGETLVVGNVRMPELKEQREQPAAYVAGRYARAGEKALPKQKAVRLPVPQPMPAYVLPESRYGAPGTIPVQGLQPGSTLPPATVPTGDLLPAPGSYPLPSELPPVSAPVPQPGWRVTPSMPEPTPPAPTMSEPTPPSLTETWPLTPTPPMTPPVGPASLNKSPSDHRQMFSFTTGLFGSQ